MATDTHFFDVVSKVDEQEIRNAVDQAQKEIRQRYDFKASKSSIELTNDGLVLISDDEGKLKSVVDVLETKLVRRGISLKALEYGKVEPATGGTVRQAVQLKQGIDKENSKKITTLIKNSGLKAQAQVQDEQVRVTAKKIDDLQAIIQKIKEADLGIAVQFVNYR
ncbi:MAG: YajQ family cyclic di-GMP-binding protein [Candidatus Latescibacteria bacterium]|nr:YajQ family cyclic di-GMP-binding protein [Candidatus Latescibacterota bacterium]